MALCHADQRYFLGQRDIKVLNKKLPMALIHECCGIVEFDPTGTYEKGQKVVMVDPGFILSRVMLQDGKTVFTDTENITKQ